MYRPASIYYIVTYRYLYSSMTICYVSLPIDTCIHLWRYSAPVVTTTMWYHTINGVFDAF